jgi:hypothetical protein
MGKIKLSKTVIGARLTGLKQRAARQSVPQAARSAVGPQ